MESITVNLMVKDVNTTVDFYKDVLGFELAMSVPESGVYNWAMVQKDKVVIMFQEEKNFKEEYKCLENRNVGGGFSIYIKMKNIKEYYDLVKPKVKIVLDYHKTFYGAYEFAIEDENGYIIAFAE